MAHAGVGDSLHLSGAIDRTNPFFLPVGTNARTCETCHAPGQGWTISSRAVGLQFLLSAGTAPLFMTHDAGSRAGADLSSLSARWQAFGSTLVARGLIRFTRTINPAAEFLVAQVDDPYGFSNATQVSAFRPGLGVASR